MLPAKAIGTSILLFTAWTIYAQPTPLRLAANHADDFQNRIVRAISVETLHQTSLRYPPRPFLAVGPNAEVPTGARYFNFDVESEYTVGHLRGAKAEDLVEIREILSVNGRLQQTPEVARRALTEDIRAGENRVRKHLLGEFTRFGLMDVATDYGLILLAFTTAGQRELRVSPSGEEFVGSEPAIRYQWEQTSGGAVEFRGRNAEHRILQGFIWVRKLDGMPLRISAWFEHAEPGHKLRDTATVEFKTSPLGFPAPVSVVHRHYVDGKALTENLYTYAPFRLFTTDTNIRYSATPDPSLKQ